MSLNVQMGSDDQPTLDPQNPSKNFSINPQSIKDKVDIIELALEYGLDLVPQTNGEYVCLCPFHPDNETMSLRFYPDTNSFHCFGCHAGSSIFDFVMLSDGIEYKDALLKLAQRIGYIDDGIDLRPLRIANKEDLEFLAAREEIEYKIILRMRGVYTTTRESSSCPLPELYLKFENLWTWYDKQQQIFDKKLFYGTDLQVLIQKIYGFYRVFLEKICILEQEL